MSFGYPKNKIDLGQFKDKINRNRGFCINNIGEGA